VSRGRVIASAVLGIALAGGLLASASARIASRAGNDAGALRLGGSAHALSVASERALLKGETERARSLAARSIAHAPFEARSLRVFGLASIDAKDAERGVAAMALAGSLGWRDTPTQLWQAEMAARSAAWSVAAERLDALARRRQAVAEAFRLMRAIAIVPEGAQAIKARLDARPEWRSGFFGFMEPMSPELARGHEAILNAVARGRSPELANEAAPYVSMLLGRGDFARGRQLWSRWIAPPGSAPAGQLQDSTFRGAVRGDAPPGFAWTIRNIPGADATTSKSGGGSGIHVEAVGESSGTLVDQLLTLAPGSYALEVDARADAAALDSIVWRLDCQAGSAVSLPLELRTRGRTGEWRRLGARFSVPADRGCPAQLLSLGVRSSDGDSARSADFTRLRIAKLGGTT